MKRWFVLITATAMAAPWPAVLAATPADAATIDGTCTATITINYEPKVTQPIPPSPGPASKATGSGSVTMCAFPGGGPASGTLTFELFGNLTCATAQNVTGHLEIKWVDGTESKAIVTGLSNLGSVGGAAGLKASVNHGRFTGDQIDIANLRDPIALTTCLTTGLSHASGTTSLTFTRPSSSVSCAGSSTITYDPGLTATPRTVHYHETDLYQPCTSTDATLTDGEASADVEIPGASCDSAPLALFEDPAYIIEWNNEHTSTIDLMFSDTIVDGTEQVTGVGTVTSGQFTSATATVEWTYPVLDPQACMTPDGLTNQSGILTAQILLP